MAQPRPITASLWKQSPEARAYWQTLNDAPAHQSAEETPACETCGGLGYVRYDVPQTDARFGKLQRCPNAQCPTVRAQQKARYERLTRKSQIPAMYQQLTFAAWETLAKKRERMTGKWDALGAALAFVDARDRNYMFTLADAAARVDLTVEAGTSRAARNSVVFSGANGVGKTSLAVSIAQELLVLGVPTVYVRLAEFFDALKAQFNRAEGDEAEVLAVYQEAPVLVIDEFAAQVTDWRRERAEQLVNYRYTHQLPTIITTNIASADFPDVWGLILGHRVQAMAYWIVMGGIELRPRRASKESR